jgi:hypothetical protein
MHKFIIFQSYALLRKKHIWMTSILLLMHIYIKDTPSYGHLHTLVLSDRGFTGITYMCDNKWLYYVKYLTYNAF